MSNGMTTMSNPFFSALQGVGFPPKRVKEIYQAWLDAGQPELIPWLPDAGVPQDVLAKAIRKVGNTVVEVSSTFSKARAARRKQAEAAERTTVALRASQPPTPKR